MLDKTELICIDIGRLNDEICYIDETGKTLYGYKSLSHYYLNDKHEILWDNINSLFPSLHKIHVRCIKKTHGILNGFEYSPSIAVDDAFMDGILKYLSNIKQKFKFMGVYYPINSKFDIDVLLCKYIHCYLIQSILT